MCVAVTVRVLEQLQYLNLMAWELLDYQHHMGSPNPPVYTHSQIREELEQIV